MVLSVECELWAGITNNILKENDQFSKERERREEMGRNKVIIAGVY